MPNLTRTPEPYQASDLDRSPNPRIAPPSEDVSDMTTSFRSSPIDYLTAVDNSTRDTALLSVSPDLNNASAVFVSATIAEEMCLTDAPDLHGEIVVQTYWMNYI